MRFLCIVWTTITASSPDEALHRLIANISNSIYFCFPVSKSEVRWKISLRFKVWTHCIIVGSTVNLRPNSITLSSSRAGSPAGMRPASELDSVMEFGLLGAIQLASSSQTSCEPVCDQVRAISTCRDSSNLSTTGRKPGLRPARELDSLMDIGLCDVRRGILPCLYHTLMTLDVFLLVTTVV